jgi:hypothetical protein
VPSLAHERENNLISQCQHHLGAAFVYSSGGQARLQNPQTIVPASLASTCAECPFFECAPGTAEIRQKEEQKWAKNANNRPKTEFLRDGVNCIFHELNDHREMTLSSTLWRGYYQIAPPTDFAQASLDEEARGPAVNV